MSEAKKIEFDHVSLMVTPRFEQTGSIGAGNAASRLVDVETKLELESSASPDVVAGVVALAERMCFVLDAIRNPRAVNATATLNGVALATDD